MTAITNHEVNTYFSNLRSTPFKPQEQIRSLTSSGLSLLRNTASVAEDAFGVIKFSNRTHKLLEATKFIYFPDLSSSINPDAGIQLILDLKNRAWVNLSCYVAETTETVGLVLEATSSIYTSEKVAKAASILGNISVVFGLAHFVRDYRELRELQMIASHPLTQDASQNDVRPRLKCQILAKKIDLFVSSAALLGYLCLTVASPSLVPAASLFYFSSSAASAINKVLPLLSSCC